MFKERLLTPAEAAKRLSISPLTLKDWLRAGKFPGLKVGRDWRVKESDLPAIGIAPEKIRAALDAAGINVTAEKTARFISILNGAN